jgi:hypothetical protein
VSKLKIKAGTTSKAVSIFVRDSSVSTGAGLTGLAFGSAGLKWSYRREGASSWTAITPVTATVGTWTSAGFKEESSSLAAGVYEIGIPNVVLASGANTAKMILYGASNMSPVLIEIELDAIDYQNGNNAGLAWLIDETTIKSHTDLITSGTTITVQASTVVTNNNITARRGDTWTIILTNLGVITGYSKIWFSIKSNPADDDTASLAQVVTSTGLLYLNGASGTANQASITVDNATTGNLTIVLSAPATAQLSDGYYTYDIQALIGTTVSTLLYGNFHIITDVTRVTS